MNLDDAFGNGKPESRTSPCLFGSGFIGPIKSVKDKRQIAFRDRIAIIHDLNDGLVFSFLNVYIDTFAGTAISNRVRN